MTKNTDSKRKKANKPADAAPSAQSQVSAWSLAYAQALQQEYERQLELCDGMKTKAMFRAGTIVLRAVDPSEDYKDGRESVLSVLRGQMTWHTNESRSHAGRAYEHEQKAKELDELLGDCEPEVSPNA